LEEFQISANEGVGRLFVDIARLAVPAEVAHVRFVQGLKVKYGVVVIGFGLLLTVGCRKRSASAPTDAPGSERPTGEKAPVVVVADPPKNQPEGTRPLPSPPPKEWSQRTSYEKLVQMDFWLNQHQFGDPAQKARVAGEVRAAGLSPTERKELEETRKRLGYAPIPQ
jgi:hypothetical protein